MRFAQLNCFASRRLTKLTMRWRPFNKWVDASRTYVLSVAKTNDRPERPATSSRPTNSTRKRWWCSTKCWPRQSSQRAAHYSFVDFASWWGGITELAAWRGKTKDEFFTDPQVKEDYKAGRGRRQSREHQDQCALQRRQSCARMGNLATNSKPRGVGARGAPGGETVRRSNRCRKLFHRKRQSRRGHRAGSSYQGDPVKMIAQIHESVKRAAGKKVYMAGEFGFVSTEAMRAIMDAIIKEPAVAGGLIWSLRFRQSGWRLLLASRTVGRRFLQGVSLARWPGGCGLRRTSFMRLVREGIRDSKQTRSALGSSRCTGFVQRDRWRHCELARVSWRSEL